MNVLNLLLSFVGIKKETSKKSIQVNDFVDLQPEGGRKSADSMVGNSNIPNEEIKPDFPIQYLDQLAQAGIFDRYFGKAIDNNELANTTYKIEFSGASKKQIEAMKQHIESRKNSWTLGGHDAMLKNCFRDLSIFGAVSAERVPNDSFSGLKELAFINHSEIRFIVDAETRKYTAVQKPKKGVSNNIEGIRLGRGYDYIPLKNATSYSPYALPPFLSAMEDLEIQKEVIKSINSGIKKMGAMGFMTAEISAPQQKENEADEEFKTRATQKIKDAWDLLKKGLANGMAVGFQHQHNFKLHPSNSNIAGADHALKLINRLVFAGMKQDPNLMGDLQAVTETFARVLLVQLTRNLEDYQKAVAEFLRRVFVTELVLAGYNPTGLKVVFEKPMIGDSLKDSQKLQLDIQNVTNLLNIKMIDMAKGAEILGFDAPFSDTYEPPANSSSSEKPNNSQPEEDVTNETRPATTQNNFEAEFMESFSDNEHLEYMNAMYHLPEEYLDFGFLDGEQDDYTRKGQLYFNRVNRLYSEASKGCQKDLKKALKNKNFSSQEDFAYFVMRQFRQSYQKRFRDKILDLAKSNIQRLYRHARQDKKVFRGRNKFSLDFSAPKMDLGLNDYRIIDFLASADSFYLGKFINDPDTVRRFMNMLIAEYGMNAGELGRDSEAIDRITARFGDAVNNEKWKVRRIVETTLNKTRTYGNLMYMNQGGVQRFVIVEAMDNLTCQHCKSMNGRTFEVPMAVNQIKREIESPPSEIPKNSPFVTQIPVEKLRQMKDIDLASQGFSLPPYHGSCRGITVADV